VTVESNPTSFPTSYSRILVVPSQQIVQSGRGKQLRSSNYTSVRAYLATQGNTWQKSQGLDPDATNFQTNLISDPLTPAQSTLMPSDPMQFVLVWPANVTIVAQSLLLCSAVGQVCDSSKILCTMQSVPPVVYPLATIPKQISAWASVISIRTVFNWIMQDFQGGPLPQQELTKGGGGPCSGANLLFYTGTNSSFAACPPYSGDSGSESPTMARLILGGSPGAS
jgi:hypothetical protein